MNDLGLIALGASARVTLLAALGLVAAWALRRRGPSAGALASLATLVVAAGVTALAVSPWPRWWSPGLEGARAVEPAPVAVADKSPIDGSAAPVADRPVVPIRAGAWAAFGDIAREYGRDLIRAAGEPAPDRDRWRWPAWVALGFLAMSGLALGRLILGLWAVRTLRARSLAVDDPPLLAMADALRGELGLAKGVEVRESPGLATPATVGWLRPVVLLPESWRAWDDAERRAVLAHELAHVRRGDYLAGLLAQFCVSLHPYHPLVRALAGRLRLHQELAADSWGARLSGGRRAYLTALANLALRQSPRPAAWPARPFLPSRGTFLRRIEMLRDPKIIQHAPLPLRSRFAAVAAIATLGLVVAGFRGPDAAGLARAQDPRPVEKATTTATKVQAAPAAESALLDPTSASSDVHVAVDLRPATLAKNPEVKKLMEQFKGNGPEALGELIAGKIDQVLILVSERRGGTGVPGTSPVSPVVVLRAATAYDFKSFLPPKVATVDGGGFSYFRQGNAFPGSSNCFRVLDDRTFLMGTEEDIKFPPIGTDRPRGKHVWDAAYRKLAPGSGLRVAADAAWVGQALRPANGPQRPPGGLDPMALFSPLFDKAKGFGIAVDAPEGMTLDVLATCPDAESANRVADTIRAALALGRNALPNLRASAERMQGGAARPMVELVDAGEALLDSAKVEVEAGAGLGTDAHLRAKADGASLALAARLLMPAAQTNREAARRVQSINNLKQIALAMFNYHSANDCFPPAVLYGPDGKTPYSWRVAILPYIEQGTLYNEYKFDEPWDGPNNSKLLAKIPSVFRDPADDRDPTFTSYLVPTGTETLFPPGRKEGMKIQEITDGTSNTIMVVEAKRDVPWTKPDDLPVTGLLVPNGQNLPALGGFHPDGFNAALADGAVRFIKDTVNPVVLRALFTRNGGEVVSSDAY